MVHIDFLQPELELEKDVSWSEGLRIANDGNVGIGVTDPDSKLEVQGSDLLANFGGTNAGFYIRNNTANYISFQGYGSDGFIFKDGGNERIRFEAGDVGIRFKSNCKTRCSWFYKSTRSIIRR